MEIFMPIASALIGGAAAVAKDISSDTLKSAYYALKARVATNLPSVDIDAIEACADAGAQLYQEAENIEAAGSASDDPELKSLARDLAERLDAMNRAQPEHSKDFSLPLAVVLPTLDKIKLVQQYAIGPALELGILSVPDFADVMARSVTEAASQPIFVRANELRAAADQKIPQTALCVPSPGAVQFIGVHTYWFQIGDEACRRGPRMAVSLLLSLPLTAWEEFGAEAFYRLPRKQGKYS